MLTKTKIPWATHSWGILSGCSPASIGCSRCYAAAMARRFHRPWGKPEFFPDKLGEPKAHKKPARIFVASCSDIFHECVCQEWRNRIYEAMQDAPQHTYCLLTKRPQNITGKLLCARNWWIGVSAENQEQYDKRWPVLCERVTAKVKFVSVEPMLGPTRICGRPPDWVICGPENGAGKRPCDQQWISDTAMDCVRLGIPFFDKRDQPNIGREYPC